MSDRLADLIALKREAILTGLPISPRIQEEIDERLEICRGLVASIDDNRAKRETKSLTDYLAKTGIESEESWRADFRRRFPPWTKEPAGDEYGLLIRTSGRDGKTQLGHFGMAYPEAGYVEAPDFNPDGPVSGGIYGLLGGIGDWGLIPGGETATWQVLTVCLAEAVPSNFVGTYGQPEAKHGAHRVPRGWVRYSGDAQGAFRMILPAMVEAIRRGEEPFVRFDYYAV